MVDTIPLAGTLDGEAVRTFSLKGKEYRRGTKVPRSVLETLPPLNYRGMINGGMLKLLAGKEAEKKASSKSSNPSLAVILSANFRELRRLAKKHMVQLARTDKTEDVREKLKLAFNY